jgi:hydrogenase maturation protease
MRRTILVGLGNPILGDDGVGWKVVQALEENTAHHPLASPFDVDYLSLGGISLMERLIGYDRAILVDAIQNGKPDGEVTCLPLEALPDQAAGHTTSAHDTNLPIALRLGRQAGAHLPEEIIVVGIEARRVYDFSEELSPAVGAAVPTAARLVTQLLTQA